MTDPPTPPAAEPKPVRRLLKPRKATLYADVARLTEENGKLRAELILAQGRIFWQERHPLRLWWRRVMGKG